MPVLYSYFRSSAAYRVRIAFNIKGLDYLTSPIHLQKEGGQNRKPDFRAVNPLMGADLIIVDGQPHVRIGDSRQVRTVVYNGVPFDTAHVLQRSARQ